MKLYLTFFALWKYKVDSTHSCKILSQYCLGIKGKPATLWGPRRGLWLMIMLMDEPAMAVRIPHDNTLIVQLLTYLSPFHLSCISFSEKKGCSDSESIGGSLESLFSPGELTPVSVSPACPLMETFMIRMHDLISLLVCLCWVGMHPSSSHDEEAP